MMESMLESWKAEKKEKKKLKKIVPPLGLEPGPS